MLIVVEWSLAAYHHQPSLQALAETAAQHEVVLVCPWRAADGRTVSTLRAALPRHELVAILVDDTVAPHERRLIEDLLNDGAVPLILTSRDPVPPAVTDWLAADERLALPAGDRASQPAAPATSPATRSGSSNGSR